MKLRALQEVDDNEVLLKGSRFRVYKVGLNVEDKSDDFYEYMLVENGEREFMSLVCVKGHKSGTLLAFVKTNDENFLNVKGKDLKYSIGLKDTFLITESDLGE